jgi:uncharacterized membrane protein YphA (DoxX/SURF4 family)
MFIKAATLIHRGEDNRMGRKIAYWVCTGIVAALSLFAGFSYVSGNAQAVQGFAHVGYPAQLRILLGIAKILGVIVLVIPGFPTLKEWAYAGFTFAWTAAVIAHHVAGDGATQLMPLTLLALLAVSYLTRPASRRWQAKAAVATA